MRVEVYELSNGKSPIEDYVMDQDPKTKNKLLYQLERLENESAPALIRAGVLIKLTNSIRIFMSSRFPTIKKSTEFSVGLLIQRSGSCMRLLKKNRKQESAISILPNKD